LLTANLGLPGAGSLLAGRKVGVLQLVLSMTGLALTLIFGVKFVLWFLANRAALDDPNTDPWATLMGMWLAVRWALLGMALFGLSVLWAFLTSWSFLQAARRSVPPPVPPGDAPR
jgi:Mn2+/Fe2+ NRAMP family transporter